MNSLAQKTLFLVAGLLLIAASLYPQSVSAASASLSLSPASSSVVQGSTLTITVRMNSDEPVNAVQANLSYPANLLDFVSIGNTSAFSIVAENSGGGGSVKIGRGALPAVSGSQSVATVRFKAKTNTGTATISFTDGSSVASANSNSNIMTGSSGGNYSLKAPSVAALAQEAPKDTTPPTIKDLKVTDLTTSTATVTWTTSEPSTSEVNYGLNASYGLSATDAAMVTEHKVVLNSPLIIPATLYHFMAKSTDPGGNTVSSEDGSFTTQGLILNITVLNQDKKPVSGAKVTLAEKSAVTDKNGKAQLKDLPTGKVSGLIEHKGKKTAVSVEIDAADPEAQPQEKTFDIETSGINPLALILPVALLAVLLGLIYRKKLYTPIVGRLNRLRSAGGHAETDSPLITTIPDPPTIRPTETGDERNKLP